MTRVRYVAAARSEFLAEVRYYKERGSGLGIQFVKAVEEATAPALAFALSGSRATKNTRRVLPTRFPFAIVYRRERAGIVVFALAHRARKLGYWRSRVRGR